MFVNLLLLLKLSYAIITTTIPQLIPINIYLSTYLQS